MIELSHIHKHFIAEDGKRLEVIKDVNLDIKQGEFFVLLGFSGSGKSTLLRIMSDLDTPSHGSVLRKSDDMGFIFQSFALFPYLTVLENVAFGLKMKNVINANEQAMEQIKRVGLAGFQDAYPRSLSGGQKQRVGIARALAVKPAILFLDEPFSALDTFTAEKLREELLEIWQQDSFTVVMVTHLIAEAVQLADRIGVLSTRPAIVDEIVHVNLPRPRNPRSQEFYEIVDKIEAVFKKDSK